MNNTAGTSTLTAALCERVGQTIYGKEELVRRVLCAFFSGGHVLLEDVPGTGKTALVKALAAAVGGTCRRVQFTPDLLPSDITGIYYYRQNTGTFELRKGPVFSNLLLADEINRATPRTQAALLECMEERQVTIDGETLPLPAVCMVMATMNPLEFQGTFPLPEAQIDRFMMKLHLGYADEAAERRLVERVAPPVFDKPVCTVEDVTAARDEIASVRISDAVRDYIVRLVRATRGHSQIRVGVSSRGVVALAAATRAWAAMEGRDFVTPDDVKQLAVPVLAHRLIPQAQTNIHLSKTGEDLIEQLLADVPVPLT